MNSHVQLCETFVSIQGESTWAGTPCFFIRLAGCNLDCAYCDAAYARAGGRAAPVADLVAEFRASGLALAEVTGGEPLIQNGTAPLVEGLLAFGTVLVETNGSRDISAIPAGAAAIMDLKCPSSGAGGSMDWTNVERLRPRDEVKFVVGDRADYEWARQVIREKRLDRKCHAVLMGGVSGRVDPAELAGWILRDRLPVRLNLQWHKVLWPGKERGR